MKVKCIIFIYIPIVKVMLNDHSYVQEMLYISTNLCIEKKNKYM